MSAKQKIVHGRGLSNLNLGIFVCSIDVFRASKPVPCINYGVKHLLKIHKPLLGDSFKPRPGLDRTPRRHIDCRTEGSILNFTLSKI